MNETWIYPTGPVSHPFAGGMIVNKEGEYEVARFTDGTIAWSFANTNPGWNWHQTRYVAPLNQWTHVAVVYDGGTVTTYANGLSVDTFKGAGNIGDILPSANDFRIGGRQVPDALGNQFFSGLIDEAAIYDRALDSCRSEERRVGKECRSRWSPYH